MFNYINKDHNCYQNTVAQTLFNCKSFRRFVETSLGHISGWLESPYVLCFVQDEWRHRCARTQSRVHISWPFSFVKFLLRSQIEGTYGDTVLLVEFLISRLVRHVELNHPGLRQGLDATITPDTLCLEGETQNDIPDEIKLLTSPVHGQ